MGRSRRKYKNSRAKVKVGLPKKNPKIVKPAFNLPPKLRALIDPLGAKWDEQVGVRARTSHIIESDSLQVPPPPQDPNDAKVDEFEPIDSGSDLEEDDFKTILGKKRRDGKKAPSQPLTTMQRAHLLPLIEKYGDDYERMFRDTKLNKMQHSIATLKNMCQRYHQWKDTNPLILTK
ncbi:Nucleolar protein 16 [Bienertia sinuspersici]